MTEPTIPRAIEDFADRLQPRGRILNLMNDGYAIWSCCPIYGDDGRVHAFFTYWEHEGDFRLKPDIGMGNRGKIGHAVADHPEGPYEFLDCAFAPAGGDAWDGTCVSEAFVYKVGDRYAMYYFGNNWASQPSTPRQTGLAIADSLDGPWERVNGDGLIIPVSADPAASDSRVVVNAAMVQPPDGGFWVYYKGRAREGNGMRTIHLARAERLEGPYVKYDGNPIIDYGGCDFEDPYVWHDGERFHMLGHDLSVMEHGAGIYLQSFDGIHWSEPAKGYPSTQTMIGLKQRLEEPAVLFDADGKPEYLFCNRSWGELHEENPRNPIYSAFVFKIRNRGLRPRPMIMRGSA